MELVRQVVKETKSIRFSGNGYSDEWKVEAKKRGLPILSTTPEALNVFKDKKAMQFLISTHVLSAEEIESRYHIAVERYIKTLEIEHLTLIELTQTYVLPALEKQIHSSYKVNDSITSKTTQKVFENRLKEMNDVLGSVLTELEKFQNLLTKSQGIASEDKRMFDIVNHVQPASFKLRDACDMAERVVADDIWPLPKYREILLANSLT